VKGIFTSKLAILPAFVALTILAGCGGTIASPTPTVTQPTATSVEEKPTATSGSSGQQMDGWQTITSDEGGFSVSMPGKPIEEARDRDAAAGLFAEHSYKVSNKDATYLLSYTDFPESMHNPPDELLKYYGIVSSGDTVVQDEQVTVQGNPGRVVELDALGGTYMVQGSNSGQAALCTKRLSPDHKQRGNCRRCATFPGVVPTATSIVEVSLMGGDLGYAEEVILSRALEGRRAM